MLKCLPFCLPDIFSSRTAASSSEEKKPDAPKDDAVHVHGMWYQPSPLPRVTSRDQHFREKLINAYMGMVDGTAGLPRNADAHLWTDRKNLHALYMPIAKSNGTEIELPHSMLAKAPLTVHVDGEIAELIAQVPDKELRAKFEKLANHAAAENIGVQTDLVRLLYGALYSDNAKGTQDANNREINLHIDIDTLAETTLKKVGMRAGVRHAWNLDGLPQAKLRLQAMDRSLADMKFPEKRPALSNEELAALAEQAQKSWSTRHPAKRPEGRPVVIPDSQYALGHVSEGGEIDTLGVVPHHQEAFKVAEKVLRVLETGKHTFTRGIDPEVVDVYRGADKLVQKNAELLHRLSGKKEMPRGMALDQEQIVDYFRLAERIRQMKPALQEKIDVLSIVAKDVTRSPQEQDAAMMKIDALESIYQASGDLIEGFVNKSSYFPQVENSSGEADKDFKKLTSSILGVHPPPGFTGSWKRGELEHDKLKDYDRSSPQYKEQQQLVFGSVKAMLRPRSADE